MGSVWNSSERERERARNFVENKWPWICLQLTRFKFGWMVNTMLDSNDSMFSVNFCMFNCDKGEKHFCVLCFFTYSNGWFLMLWCNFVCLIKYFACNLSFCYQYVAKNYKYGCHGWVQQDVKNNFQRNKHFTWEDAPYFGKWRWTWQIKIEVCRGMTWVLKIFLLLF